MKESPMLFSGPMVRAYRREVDPKTQTRRTRGLSKFNTSPECWRVDPVGTAWVFTSLLGGVKHPVRCPYGITGDRLWTRESWRTRPTLNALSPSEIGRRCVAAGLPKPGMPIRYESDHEERPWGDADEVDFGCDWGKLRPGMFLPRWASRDTLEVVSARPERLNSITKSDALAEGIQVLPLQSADDPSAWYQSAPGIHQARSAESSYAGLWSEINGLGSWAHNSWVWRVEFRRVQ